MVISPIFILTYVFGIFELLFGDFPWIRNQKKKGCDERESGMIIDILSLARVSSGTEWFKDLIRFSGMVMTQILGKKFFC
jgi:hypothetical protein